MVITYFDMFAGIGGFRSGLEAIGGFEYIGCCEIDKYAKQSYAEAGIDKASGGDGYIDPNSTATALAEAVYEGNLQKIDNGVGKFFYSAGTSIGENLLRLPLAALPGGAVASRALAGTTSGVSSANDVINNGGDIEHAFSTGVAAAAAEIIFEKIPLDNLIKIKNGGYNSVWKAVSKQMVTEGLEELGTDVTNAITDQIINGDMSQLSLQYKNYIEQGYGEDKAWGKTAVDFGLQVAQSFAGGAISGGVLSGGAATLNYAESSSTGKAVYNKGNTDELVRIGKLYGQDTQAYNLASKVEEKTAGGKSANAQVGQLRSAVIQEASKASKDTYSKGVSDYLSHSKLSSAEKAVANKILNRESLTDADVELVNSSKALQKATSGMPEIENIHDDNLFTALMSTSFKLPKATTIDFKRQNVNGKSAENALDDYAAAHKMNAETKKAFIEHYDGKSNIDNYAFEFIHYNNMGRLIVPYDKINHSIASIDDSAKLAAYEAGVNVYKRNAKLANALSKAQQEWKQRNNGYTEGTVNTSAVKGETLSYGQKLSVEYAKDFAKFGVNFEFFKSEPNSKGIYTRENGSYNSATNTISVDINAGKIKMTEAIKNGAMLSAFSHELTHIAEHAADEYTELRTAVQNAVSASDWNRAVKKQLNILEKNNNDKWNSMSETERAEYASKEALAEFCSDMLKHSDILEKMANDNPKAAKTFIDTLKNIIKKIRSFLSKQATVADEATALEETADDLQSIVDKWDKAVMAGIKNQNAKTAVKESANMQKNNTADDSSVQRRLRSIPDDETINNNFKEIANMSAVSVLSGTEFKKSNIDLISQVINYYNSIGGYVETIYGKVELTKSGVKSSIAHGIGRKKAIAFKAVPNVLKKGKIIDYQTNWKNRGYDTAVFAAPVKIAEDNYYLATVVLIEPGKNSYYLHEVVLQKIEDNAVFKTGTVKNGTPSTALSPINNLLQKIQKVKNSMRNLENESDIQFQSRDNTNDIYGDSFKRWFGDWQNDPKNASKVVDENGKPLVVYHGTSRGDRVGNIFKSERATSGPMAFFTDNKSIADNYAKDKADTSIAYDEEYTDYYSQFRVTKNGKSISVVDLWNTLPYSEKVRIKENAKHITFDDEAENIIYDKTANYGVGGFDDYRINSNNGNYISALIEEWLVDGNLYGEEQKFLEVLKFFGIENAEYRNPNMRDEKVYEAYLNIKNPFDTNNANKSFYDSLGEWIENSDMSAYERETQNSDMWDKNNQTPESWLNKLADDIERDNTHAWTVIPDFVSDYLKEQGYDGIKDKGGKSGGDLHTVWIPFNSTQIKSATDNTGTFDGDNPDIRYQQRDNDFVDDNFKYSYNNLVSKPDMKITIVDDSVKYTPNAETRKSIIDQAVKNAKSVGYENESGNAVVHVKDIESDVIISKNGLRHGLDRRLNISGAVTVNAGEILKNAIKINELTPRNPEIQNSYVLIGIAKNAKNEPLFVMFVVNKFTNELTSFDVLYSLNTKTEPAGSLSPGVPTKVDYLTGSTISISDLLDYVNKYYPDILPEDVLRHYDYTSRPEGVLGENVLYQHRSKVISNRELLVNALESTAKTGKEIQNLRAYKEGVASLNEDAARLADIKKQIKEISFTKGSDRTQLVKLNNSKKILENRVVRKDKALLSLEAMESLQNVLAVEKKKLIQKTREKWADELKTARKSKDEQIAELRKEKDEYISKLRKDKNARIEEERQTGIQKRKNVIDAHKTSDYIGKIKKLQKDMVKMVQHPTDNVYVPQYMAEAFNEACVLITDAVNLNNGTKASEALQKLSDNIRKLNEGKNTDGDYNNAFDSEFISQVDNLRQLLTDKYKGRNIQRKNGKNSGLTLSEATEVYTVLHDIYYTVRDATKQLGREDAVTTRESGEKIRNDMDNLMETFIKNEILTNIKKEFLDGIRTARYYAGYNDNAEIMYHVNALNEGNRILNKYKMESEKMFSDLTEKQKKAYQASLTDVQTVNFVNYSGSNQSVQMTRMQGLQILMSWEREMQSGGNLTHMQTGGIVIPNPELFAKGKIQEAFDKAVAIRFVNPSLINAVSGIMTDFENKYRNIAESYFNEKAKGAINEVSNVLKHRDIAASDYYIPFTVNQNYLVKELDGLKYDSTIEGMGMLKSTVRKANQPILISGLNLVVDRHINDTAKVYGLAIPARNFKKALNIRFVEYDKDGNAIPVDSVRESIRRKWGKDANGFFDALITDLETSRKPKANSSEAINNAVKDLRNAMVVKTLVGNISVVIKQAASYQTAGVYISGRSLTKAFKYVPYLLSHWSEACDEIDSHTAQHYMRRIGLSTQEIAEIKGSWTDKHMPAAINPVKWIQGVDCITTALHWFAVKEEINTQYRKSGKQIGTEEYWREVTSLYDKVIEDTQPMYDSLHRAEVQKTTNELWKSAFMFKTQPLQNAGILYDSVGYALADKNNTGAKKAVVRAISSQIQSLATFALMSFLASLFLHKPKRYRDENGEVTFSSVLSRVFGDMFVNGVGLALPIFGTEITDSLMSAASGSSLFDTFSVPVIDMLNDTVESIADAYDAVTTSIDKASYGYDVNAMEIFSPLVDMGTQVAGLWGIPAQNMLNIFNGFKNHITDLANGQSTFLAAGNDRKPKEFASSYGNLYLKGNTEKAKEQLSDLYQLKYDEAIAKGEPEADAKKSAGSSVRTALTNAYKTEYQKAFLKGDQNRMQEIGNLLLASGYMKWENKMLSTVLSDWRKSAQEDVQKTYN